MRKPESFWKTVLLGILLGFAILSRQWAFFLFPALLAFVLVLIIKERSKAGILLRSFGLSSLIALLVGGWFYFHLYQSYGSIRTFNRPLPRSHFSFAHQPRQFYFGLGLDKLFREPLLPSFTNQFLPIFYSEILGDYWMRFLVYGKDPKKKQYDSAGYMLRRLREETASGTYSTNREHLKAYLGRVNAVSLLPSLVLIAGFFMGIGYLALWLRSTSPDLKIASYSLFTLFIVISFIRYGWFLIRYPHPLGSTIKATYLLQIFPFLSILGAVLLEKVRQNFSCIYRWIVLFLELVFFHNFPVLITNHHLWLL